MIFVEQLSGQTFVADLDVVKMKLAIINERMGRQGCLSTHTFFRLLGIEPRSPDVVLTVLKGVLFDFYPSKIGEADVVVIGIDKVEEEVDEDCIDNISMRFQEHSLWETMQPLIEI